MLHYTKNSPGSGPKLLIAHGLFGSGRNWGAIAKALGATHEVISVDMRNHGASFRSDVMDYPAMADDLSQVIEAEGGRMAVLGHSMGGKAAMVLALTRPELVERLIVGDIAPVPYTHSHAHLIEAMETLDLSAVSRRSQADKALAEHVKDRGTRAFLLQSLSFSKEQGAWSLNLPVLKAAMDTVTGFPQIDARFEGPTLFLGGDRSQYIPPDARTAILSQFPRARIVMLKGAGHWLHADQPEAFTKTVSVYLQSSRS